MKLLLILFSMFISIVAQAAPIKAIIFDCDGTLVDTEDAHFQSWRYALRNQGGDITLDEYYPFVGNSSETNARLLSQKIGSNDPNRILKDKRYLYEKLHSEGLPSIQPTIDFIHELAQVKDQLGLKLGIASAAKKKDILASLKNAGIDQYFDIVLSGQEDIKHYNDPEGVNKPKPYIYLEAAKLLNVKPENCIVIEDSRSGVTAAAKAGCFTIAIPNRFTIQHDFSLANMKIESLKDIDPETLLKMANP